MWESDNSPSKSKQDSVSISVSITVNYNTINSFIFLLNEGIIFIASNNEADTDVITNNTNNNKHRVITKDC